MSICVKISCHGMPLEVLDYLGNLAAFLLSAVRLYCVVLLTVL